MGRVTTEVHHVQESAQGSRRPPGLNRPAHWGNLPRLYPVSVSQHRSCRILRIRKDLDPALSATHQPLRFYLISPDLS